MHGRENSACVQHCKSEYQIFEQHASFFCFLNPDLRNSIKVESRRRKQGLKMADTGETTVWGQNVSVSKIVGIPAYSSRFFVSKKMKKRSLGKL